MPEKLEIGYETLSTIYYLNCNSVAKKDSVLNLIVLLNLEIKILKDFIHFEVSPILTVCDTDWVLSFYSLNNS